MSPKNGKRLQAALLWLDTAESEYLVGLERIASRIVLERTQPKLAGHRIWEGIIGGGFGGLAASSRSRSQVL